MTWKEVKVCEIKENNQEVLKKLFWIKPKHQSTDQLIDSLDTKIKGDFFN